VRQKGGIKLQLLRDELGSGLDANGKEKGRHKIELARYRQVLVRKKVGWKVDGGSEVSLQYSG